MSTIVGARSVIGVTQSDLNAAPAGILDHRAALNVRLAHGALSSISEDALLSGGNLAAIGDGSTGNWEIVQFRNAELVAPGTYVLTELLRGQAGSDGIAPIVWPEGSWFVLLNGIPKQIPLVSNLRNINQNFLIGPASNTYDHPSFLERSHAFAGNGLRPFAPVHLCVDDTTPTHSVSWVRRTRIEGDDWGTGDVPVGEEAENYVLRVKVNDAVVREEALTETTWAYSDAQRATDGVFGIYSVEVAQMSARYGLGPFRAAQAVA